MQLADAIVTGDTAAHVNDLLDRDGILVSAGATIQRTREPLRINPDPLHALKFLFKYKISKRKQEESSDEEEEEAPRKEVSDDDDVFDEPEEDEEEDEDELVEEEED